MVGELLCQSTGSSPEPEAIGKHPRESGEAMLLPEQIYVQTYRCACVSLCTFCSVILPRAVHQNAAQMCACVFPVIKAHRGEDIQGSDLWPS